MASLAALLSLPRPAEPSVLPLPDVDADKLDGIMRDGAARTEQVMNAPLSFSVRAAGEAFRNYGAASQRTLAEQLDAEQEFTRRISEALEASGPEPLSNLLALQTELFLEALTRWEATGKLDSELVELGGNFPQKARVSGWLKPEGGLVLSTRERVVLFRMRWTSLAGLSGRHPFKPTLAEWRAYYAFLLQHPESSRLTHPPALAQKRLGYVNALARLDSDYPSDFARGIALHQAGDYLQAARAFQTHLMRHPNGPWTLRARNFWLSSTRRATNPAP